MKELILTLTPDTKDLPDEQILKLLDLEVDCFEKFMTSDKVDWKARGPLLPQERALIKTYIVQKFRGRLDG
jgi:hypothetical protein